MKSYTHLAHLFRNLTQTVSGASWFTCAWWHSCSRKINMLCFKTEEWKKKMTPIFSWCEVTKASCDLWVVLKYLIFNHPRQHEKHHSWRQMATAASSPTQTINSSNASGMNIWHTKPAGDSSFNTAMPAHIQLPMTVVTLPSERASHPAADLCQTVPKRSATKDPGQKKNGFF